MHKLNKNRKRRASYTYLGLGLITAPAVVSGAILSSSYAFAGNSAVDNINLDLPISCRVSATGMDSHTTISANGTYTDDIGTTTMKITCNDNGGFSVYAAGYTGDEVGGTNSNKLVGTAASGNATIETGTATGPGYDEDVSNWAMMLGSTSSDYPISILGDYDYYHAVPNSLTKVATRTAGTDVGDEAIGATLTSTYAVYISKTQPADTYTGQVKYTLLHPHDAPVPVATLYLQDTANIAAAVPNIGDTANALDIRDNKEYTVGKLADGNIWLLDNLDLDLTMANASGNITDENTNASATSLNALFNGVTGGGQDGNLAQAAVIDDHWTSSYTDPVIDTHFSGSTLSEATNYSYGGYDDDWMVGTYYNYCAASAGSYCYAEDPETEDDATEDICPSGWRMPTAGYYAGEYYNLYTEYANESSQYDAFVTALRLPFSGWSNSDYEYYQLGRGGRFWSSTFYGYEGEMRSLGIESGSGADFSNHTDRSSDGNSVRCIMDTN